MSKFLNRTVVITGGTSGIGLETARQFIARGANVVITGRNRETHESAVQDLGEKATGIVSDTSNLKQIAELVDKVKLKFGTIDTLFINAGIAKFASVAESTEEMLDETFNINFKGAFFTAQFFLPILKDGGSITFTSSVVTHVATPNASVYAASKGALNALVNSMANELAARRIRVNTVSPGPISTAIFDKLGYPKEAVEAMEQEFSKKTLTGRFGRPQDVARAVVFLSSNEAEFVTGSDFRIDGGISARIGT